MMPPARRVPRTLRARRGRLSPARCVPRGSDRRRKLLPNVIHLTRLASAHLAAVVACAIAIPPVSQASRAGPLRFASDSALARIPIEVRGNLIYMRGRVDDSDSLWIVLDSGASSNAINDSRARSLGLPITGSTESHGAGGVVTGGIVPSATVELPGLTIEGEPLGTLPLDSIATRSGRAMDLILGYPLLRACVATIDYAVGILTIRHPGAFRDSVRGVAIPLEFKNDLPYLSARLALPGRHPIQGRFVLDTGSGHALILSAPFVRQAHALETLPGTIEARGLGVGGESRNALGRVTSLEIGGLRIDRPTAMLRLSDRGVVAGGDAIGNIGGEILRRFTVTFDYPRKRVILEPNTHLAEPIEADMSGLGLRVGPEGSQAVRVEWILPRSPAEEAGVQAGDLIESIDGRPAATFGMPALREMFRPPGESHRLAIRRGQSRIEVALTTRRLI